MASNIQTDINKVLGKSTEEKWWCIYFSIINNSPNPGNNKTLILKDNNTFK